MGSASPSAGGPRSATAISKAIDVVGDAWSWLILREAAFNGIEKFDDFRVRLGISRSTLTGRLGRLVRGGLLEQRPAAHRAGLSVYVLAERGEDFFPVLMTALRWGDDWAADGQPRPLILRHTDCGQVLNAALVCGTCHEPLRAREVRATMTRSGPGQTEHPARSRSPELDLLERCQESSIARCLKVIGDRWSSLVLRASFLGIRRFDQFQAELGIAESILSQRLSRLVDADVLRRRPYQVNPPRDEYLLTDRGLALYPVYIALLAWGDRWLPAEDRWLMLTHRPCGAGVSPVLACEGCGAPVGRDSVAGIPAPRDGAVVSS
jgi:DNA-binding HxlR family transcriptional regulator